MNITKTNKHLVADRSEENFSLADLLASREKTDNKNYKNFLEKCL